jgi:hypothetical protein
MSLMLSSRNLCLIIASVCMVPFPRFAQHLMHTHCWIHREFVSSQVQNSKQKDVKNQHIHPAMWNFVHGLPRYASTIISLASCYCNCCTHSSACPGNYG